MVPHKDCFAVESAVNELAEKMGIDPVALREKNYRDRRSGDACVLWRNSK